MQLLDVDFTYLSNFSKLQHKQGIYKKKRQQRSSLALFNFAALIRPWTQSGILEAVSSKFKEKNPTTFLSRCERAYLNKGRYAREILYP